MQWPLIALIQQIKWQSAIPHCPFIYTLTYSYPPALSPTMTRSTQGRFIGPVPVNEFMKYIDPDCDGAPALQADFGNVPATRADVMSRNFVSPRVYHT